MQAAARFFKVLSDEARLKIIWLLFNERELCVCDIMAAVGITQSKVSRHLATLRHAGLVADRKDGLWSYYSLCPASDDVAVAHIGLLRKSLAGRTDAAPLVDRLREWLQAKEQGVVCSKEGAGAFTKRSAAGRARRRKAASR